MSEDDFDDCKDKIGTWNITEDPESGKNAMLVNFALHHPFKELGLPLSSVVREFSIRWKHDVAVEVQKFLDLNDEQMWFVGDTEMKDGNILAIGPVKEEYRIDQKLKEYSVHFLKTGVHVIKKFKDLFRGSITLEAFSNIIPRTDTNIDVKFVKSKERQQGNYRAFFVTLAVKGVNFELKVVKSLAALEDSHLYYEILRHDSLENLELFLQRHVSKIPWTEKDQHKFLYGEGILSDMVPNHVD